jgi:hypothetical protein
VSWDRDALRIPATAHTQTLATIIDQEMKKESKYLGLGLLLALGSFDNSGTLLPWQLYLAIGFSLVAYGTYLMVTTYERTEVLKYVIATWIILIAIGYWTVSKSLDSSTIRESDLIAATNFEKISTCEEGRSKAETDIKNGKLKYLFGSFGGRQPLAKNLKENYDIEVIILDGVLGIPNECYNQVMYKEIQRKYGQDIFNKEMGR